MDSTIVTQAISGQTSHDKITNRLRLLHNSCPRSINLESVGN